MPKEYPVDLIEGKIDKNANAKNHVQWYEYSLADAVEPLDSIARSFITCNSRRIRRKGTHDEA